MVDFLDSCYPNSGYIDNIYASSGHSLLYSPPFFNSYFLPVSNPYMYSNCNSIFSGPINPLNNMNWNQNNLWQNPFNFNNFIFCNYKNPLSPPHSKSSKASDNGKQVTEYSGDAKEVGEQLYKKCQKIAQKRGLTQEFFTKVASIAKKINCDPMALIVKMYASSGLKTDAVNKSSGAVGLNQFLPKSKHVKAAGGSQAYLKLSALEQLDYIEKFFVDQAQKYGGKRLEAEDIFAINFLPSRAGNDVLTKVGDQYYDKARDKDGDGDVDKKDMRTVYEEKLNKMLNC